MGQFDSLAFGALNAPKTQGPASLANANLGGLQGLVNQLQASGLGGGGDLPIAAAELRTTLSSDQVKQIAAHFGIDPEAALKRLSGPLPAAVDAASPGGEIAAQS